MSDSVALHVELQEGFDGDRVEVDVAGRRFEFPDLSTRTQIGLAEVVDLEIPRGPTVVRISLPGRALVQRSQRSLSGEAWLAVNLSSEGLDLSWSEEPLFYA